MEVIIAAILHDTVEDTDTSFEEVEAEFGKKVRDIVAEVSDDKSLAKAERKRLQIVHSPHKSNQVGAHWSGLGFHWRLGRVRIKPQQEKLRSG